MAHSDKIISSIRIPGIDGSNVDYQIHDAQAIHSAEELGLSAALIFKGTKDKVNDLPTTGNKVGDVWYVTEDGSEHVWADTNNDKTGDKWEKLGNVHDAASSSHTHTVTVTGHNGTSAVTGQVTVPTVTKTQKYMTASAAAPTVTQSTDSVLGANTEFVVAGGKATTTKIKATASGVDVAGNGTAKAITGFGAHTTNAALGTDATFKVTGGAATTSKMVTSTASKVSITDKSIPNVTANTKVTASKVTDSGSKTAGTAASWSASVSDDGVLSFNFAPNVPTAVTLPTFSDVTATNTTLGDVISVSAVTANDVTVATGALSTSGEGSAVATGVSAISVAVDSANAVNAITALGTATTADALTGVKVVAQPTVTLAAGDTGDISVVTGVTDISVTASGDSVSALTSVRVAPSAITLTNNADEVDGAVPVVSAVTIGSTPADIVNGLAAAQTWTQDTGSTSAPK